MFNFIKNLFSSADEPMPERHLDNTRLNFLLNNFKDHPSEANNNLILKEIAEGDCFFMIPAAPKPATESETSGSNVPEITLACFNEVDGLKTVGVFTEQHSFLKWAQQQPMELITLRCAEAIQFFQTNKINHIHINVGAGNAFVVGQNMGKMVGWSPVNAVTQITSLTGGLATSIGQNLRSNFQANSNILEVYAFNAHRESRTWTVFAAKLGKYSDEGRFAYKYAVEDALSKEDKLSFTYDIAFLESDDLYKTVNELSNALVYKKHV